MINNSLHEIEQDLGIGGFSRLLGWLITATLFLYSIVLFRTPFEGYLSYIIVVALLPFLLVRYTFPAKLSYLFLWFLTTGLIGVYSEDNEGFLLFKILLNIVVSTLFYYYVFSATQGNVVYWFKLYLKMAFWAGVLGVIQLIAYNIGFKPGYDFSFILNKWGLVEGGVLGIRLNSIFSEPSYYGSAMAPAFFVAVYSLLAKEFNGYSKLQAAIIIFTYIFSFSSVAYAGVFVTGILLLINFSLTRYIAIAIPVGLIVFQLIYSNVYEFRVRVDGLVELYSGRNVSVFDVHGSSFVQYNNFQVAAKNFQESPIWGTGLGSHPVAYEKYSLTPIADGVYNFNSMDANSMAFRLLSETGIVGLGFIVLFIFRYFVIRREKNENQDYWVISSSVLLVILLQLLRQGNYTYGGFMFFMWMYYFTSVKNRELFADEG